jgi:hypothetical protein
MDSGLIDIGDEIYITVGCMCGSDPIWNINDVSDILINRPPIINNVVLHRYSNSQNHQRI